MMPRWIRRNNKGTEEKLDRDMPPSLFLTFGRPHHFWAVGCYEQRESHRSAEGHTTRPSIGAIRLRLSHPTGGDLVIGRPHHFCAVGCHEQRESHRSPTAPSIGAIRLRLSHPTHDDLVTGKPHHFRGVGCYERSESHQSAPALLSEPHPWGRPGPRRIPVAARQSPTRQTGHIDTGFKQEQYLTY